MSSEMPSEVDIIPEGEGLFQGGRIGIAISSFMIGWMIGI